MFTVHGERRLRAKGPQVEHEEDLGRWGNVLNAIDAIDTLGLSQTAGELRVGRRGWRSGRMPRMFRS
jgi:hypothetical protein